MTRNDILKADQFMPTDERSHDILKKRATEIARVSNKIDEGKDKVEYVKFSICADQIYGIDYKYIVSVKNDAIINNSPVQQNRIVGLYSYRGSIISIIDLSSFIPSKKLEKSSDKNRNILIVKHESMCVALLVDSVLGTDNYDAAQLQIDCMERKANESKLLLGIHRGNTGIIDIEYILQSI